MSTGVEAGRPAIVLDAHQRAAVSAAVPSLRKMVRAIAPQFPQFEPDELVQMASESATRSMLRHDPRGGASFVTFAWHRALGEILDYAERERRRRVALRGMYGAIVHVVEAFDDLGDPFTEPEAQRFERLDDLRFATRAAVAFGLLAPVATPEDAFLEAEERARIEACLRFTLDAVDPAHGALVTRHLVDGESIAAIARGLGEDYSAVQKRFARALAKMGRAMRAWTDAQAASDKWRP